MQLPKSIDPIKFAKQNAHLRGELALSTCDRLQEMYDQHNNQAMVELQFGQDKVYFIKGHLTAGINLICQRCNHPMQYEMDISFNLSPVTSEERAKKLPEMYEPVFMQDEMVEIRDMIEDEILLALPMVPKHETCPH